MKKFIKVLDSVIDTNWLILCWLNKGHTLLKVNQVQGQSKKAVRYGRA